MATSKLPKRRSSRTAQLSRHTRAAYEGAQRLLDRIVSNAALHPLKEHGEARQLIDQLNKDLSVLAVAPKLRIGAARRLQGASTRRRTASQLLFDACAEVRRRVKLRYRGPRHAALRQAFGEGLPASPAKPETVLSLARQILSAAAEHPGELREVRVGPPTVQRLNNLQESLRSCAPERSELRSARRQVSEDLVAIADRVIGLCNSLTSLALRLCPTAELEPIMPPAPPKPPGPRSRHGN